MDYLIGNLNGTKKNHYKTGFVTRISSNILRTREKILNGIFHTHGIVQMYAQLNSGTNSASNICQNIISEQIHDIPETIKICDDNDVMVFGKTQADL